MTYGPGDGGAVYGGTFYSQGTEEGVPGVPAFGVPAFGGTSPYEGVEMDSDGHLMTTPMPTLEGADDPGWQSGETQYAIPESGESLYSPPQYGPPQYGPPQYGPPQYGPSQSASPGYVPPPSLSTPIPSGSGWQTPTTDAVPVQPVRPKSATAPMPANAATGARAFRTPTAATAWQARGLFRRP